MKNEPTYDFHALTALRIGKGWTQSDLALKIKRSVVTVSLFEKGINQSPKTAARIARVHRKNLRDFVIAGD